MRKISYFIFTFIFLFAFSCKVDADRGDLNYEITNVNVNNNYITISGYAFIHKTNNYVTVYKRNADGTVTDEIVNVENGVSGGQKVKIRIAELGNENNYFEVEYNCVDDNYNFYYQMFNKDWCSTSGSMFYDYTTYNNSAYNVCNSENDKPCYYEDLGFTIKISVDALREKFSSDMSLVFYIAASNNDYGKWTSLKELKIPKVTNNSDYIEIIGGEYRNGVVGFIASSAIFRDIGFGGGFYAITNTNYNIVDYDEGGFTDGTKISSDINRDISIYCSTTDTNRVTHFLDGTIGPRMYALCAYDSGGTKGYNACTSVNSNGYCGQCSGKIVAAFGSWITLTGSNQLKIKLKNPNLCEVTDPDGNSGSLSCNGNKSYNSTCEKLSVITSDGFKDVMIEQNGTISSVLTPDSLYAGGGFSFGVMYYNTIKWSYVGSRPNDNVHNEVVSIMNDKLKKYDDYVAGLNITQLNLGGKAYDSSFLNKTCTTSDSGNDYYNKELTVSCLFSFPESKLYYDGTVDYITGGVFNINNKFYTNIYYENSSDKFKLQASIVGMDRITENASRSDSKDNKGWTGDWSDTFTNCEIDLYGLLMKNGIYNFIYRPIDIFNPFPNRNAGINWFDWYNNARNVERLESTYSDIDYTVTLDNNAIADIKNYNSGHNYLEWDSIDEITNESSFVTERNYVVRGGN